MAYRILYTARAREHLRDLTARQRATVVGRIGQQLLHQPLVRTRNRKPMEPNPVARWELRVGDIPVYYAVWGEAEPVVEIHALGLKVRNRVRIGGEEFEFP